MTQLYIKGFEATMTNISKTWQSKNSYSGNTSACSFQPKYNAIQ